jgi:hypothetical protein
MVLLIFLLSIFVKRAAAAGTGSSSSGRGEVCSISTSLGYVIARHRVHPGLCIIYNNKLNIRAKEQLGFYHFCFMHASRRHVCVPPLQVFE